MKTSWTTRIAVAGLALCLASAGCRSSEQKFADHLDRGAQFEQQGKRDEALLEYRNALKIQPASAEANLRIARVLTDKGKYGDAIFFLREAQRLDPTNSEAALSEAKLLLFQDPARVEQIVKDVLSREPANALAYLRLAELGLAKDDTKAALSAVMTAIELDPKDGLYPFNLGVVQQAQIREMRGKKEQPPDTLFQAALDAFRKSDELYGGNLNAKLMIARTYASWPGHEKEAETALRETLAYAKEKGTLEDRRNAAQALLDYANVASRPDLRAQGLAEMVEADPGALGAWAELAAAADAQGKSGEEVYQRLLVVRPNDVGAYVAYAGYLAGKGRGADAVKTLDDAAGKGADPATALDAKTRLLIQLGKPDQARATVERMRKEWAASPRTSLASARLALSEKRAADAVADLGRVTSSVEDAEAFYLLSLAEGSLGHREPAIAAIDRAVALTPQPPLTMLQQKVALHAAARDWPAVIQALQRIEAATGQLPVGMRPLLAQALFETKNDEAGRQVLERMMNDSATQAVAAVVFADREGARDPQAAYKHLEAALAANPDEPPLIAALARLDMSARRFDRAAERLGAALAKGKDNPSLRLLRAQALALQGDLAGAEADARKVLESDSNVPGTVTLLVAIYTARGNLEQATNSMEEMDKAGQLRGSGRELLGRLYQSRGDSARARAQFEKALSEDASLAEAKNGLAFLLATDRTDLDRALELAQEAQRQLPNVPEVADTLGYVYLQKGLSDAAIDRFRFALELAQPGVESSPSIRYHLGLALAAAGRNEEAADAFEKALASKTAFPEAADARQALERARAARGTSPPAGSS